MVSISGYAEFFIPPDKKVIVSSADIAWNDAATSNRSTGGSANHSGQFDIAGVGEASLEVYEYSKGVCSYRNVTLPNGCECVSMFNIEA
ncbi:MULTISPECIES: hypothetical protein [Bombella]|uniref:Uncharacterized protein n=1 Tax=Bombella pollinis TaxID=2967337 RepID=A0ABT3WJ82_9PROT|nr:MULTISPECIES: hypothetical protein [Bombella]MCX5618983.1 hypothetical protein [Bombella pollinis]MUG04000.1 hypothetical protein [Bombella sp. ESL0378]MUG89494.1 hypothetical protein [Bombella sp. ESL0385]